MDTDFFAAKLRWVRAGPFRRKKVCVRVRVRVVEFSFYPTNRLLDSGSLERLD